jgi:peptidoglycan/xylan/chitin deacetylase (PgdA/CDA1 family)
MLAAAVLCAFAVLAAARAAGPAEPGPALVSDPADTDGPLDVLGVGLEQDGGVMALTVHVRGVPPVSALGARGRSLCLRLGPVTGGPRRGQVCVRARPRIGPEYRKLDSTGGPDSVARITGRVLRPKRDTVVLRFHAADARLPSGPFAWSLRTTWRGSAPSHCAPRPGNPVGCADVVPDAGALPGSVAPIPAAASCTPAGAEFRTSGSRLERAVALTFDDGPGPATAAILSELERERAPATFFVVGEHVVGHEGLLRRMLGDGDAIGDHSFSHADLAKDRVLARSEIDKTKRAVERATGYVPCLFRAPFGDVSPTLVQEAAAAGLVTVQWDVDPRDWSLPPHNQITATVLAQTRDGSIVLMHDGGGPREPTVAALPGVIQSLRARGFRLVTVPHLLGLTAGPV